MRSKFALLATLVATLVALPGGAQEQTTTIAGIVSGPEGIRLQGVNVDALRENGLRLTSVTDRNGFYQVRSVPPGRYVVSASAAGFKTAAVQNVDVRLGEAPTIDLRLSLAAVDETINVTGHAPLVDVRSNATQTNVKSSEFERLPHGRDFTSVALYTPGVTDEVTAGGLSIGGSSGGENHYVIDGVDATDPRFGIAGKSVVADAIEEVEVKVAGYEAEFGGATGGVINTVTKTGTNDRKGSFFTYLRNSAWNGRPRPILQANGVGNAFRVRTLEKDDVKTYEPGVTSSGPLIRDRLWYFVLASPTARDTVRTATSSRETFRRADVIANVSGVSGDRITFKAAANVTRNRTRGTLADAQGTLAVNPITWAGLNDRALNHTYSGYVDLITRLLRIEAHGGRYLTRHQVTGTPDEIMLSFYGDMGAFPEVPPELRRPDGFVSIPTGQGNVAINRDSYTRDNLSLAAEWAISRLGHHDVKAGIQMDDTTNDVRSGYQQPWYVYLWDQPGFSNTRGKYGALSIEMETEEGRATARGHAMFLQDRWILPGERLTLFAGIRGEEETIPSYADAARGLPRKAIRFGWRDKLAPRLGFAWDVIGDRKLKLYGSYGTYFDRTKMAVARELFGGYRDVYYDFDLDTYDWQHLLCTGINQLPTDHPTCNGAATFVKLFDQRPVANDPAQSRIAPNIKPMQSREWSLGVEQQLTTSFLVGVSWIHRELVHAIESIGIDRGSGRTIYLANPGEGIARNVKAGVPALPRPRREYDGVELESSTRAGQRLSLHLSYLYSRLWGNYSGVFNSDDRHRSLPYLSAFGDSPANLYDAHGNPVYGLLATDRPHQVKAQAAYDFPTLTTIGLNQWVASGTPVSLELVFQNVPFFPEGRGNLGRTPRVSQTDLFVAQRFNLGRSRAEVNVTVLNAFEHKTPISIYSRYAQRNIPVTEAQFFSGFDPSAAMAKVRQNPLYGRPNVWQAAREIRAGVRFMF